MSKNIIILSTLVAVLAAGCGGGGSGSPTPPVNPCPEDGPYACKTGATEPLYSLQWALNSAKSIFNTIQEFTTGVVNPNIDLNVESAHLKGIKGQGVNVIVLDDGLDVAHEDLRANIDRALTFNFLTQSNDPTPTGVINAHGTNVAGIIAAAQNGIGLMGIAPRARLGGANFLAEGANPSPLDALGGSAWSMRGHVFNGSFGADAAFPAIYDEVNSDEIRAVRNLVALRGAKGALFIKAAGNQFVDNPGANLQCAPFNDSTGNPIDTNIYRPQSCDNPSNDIFNLEPTTLTIAALNAKSERASYSSAGSTVWVSGYGGELTAAGKYGELNTDASFGPNMFSTDLTGCIRGYSRTGATGPDFQIAGTATNADPAFNNSECNYSVMNGTSAATPSMSGVVALLLHANPNLTWKDVRFILAKSARAVNADYRNADQYLKFAYDMANDRFSAVNTASAAIADISAGKGTIPFVPLELGWVTNAAGYQFSNWFGFGLPDTAKAVEMAQNYTTSLGSTITYPAFADALNPTNGTIDLTIPSGELKPIATFTYNGPLTVDTLQLMLAGDSTNPASPLCLGRLALYVVSPKGTVSLLQPPNNIFSSEYSDNGVIIRPVDSDASVTSFGMASMAFYGEQAQGVWTIYGGLVNAGCGIRDADNINIKYRVLH